MDTAQFLSRSMQTSLNEQDLEEATQNIFQEMAAGEVAKNTNFEFLYA